MVLFDYGPERWESTLESKCQKLFFYKLIIFYIAIIYKLLCLPDLDWCYTSNYRVMMSRFHRMNKLSNNISKNHTTNWLHKSHWRHFYYWRRKWRHPFVRIPTWGFLIYSPARYLRFIQFTPFRLAASIQDNEGTQRATSLCWRVWVAYLDVIVLASFTVAVATNGGGGGGWWCNGFEFVFYAKIVWNSLQQLSYCSFWRK